MNREFKISLSQECYSDVIYLSQYDDDYSIVLTVLNKYSLADISGYSYQLEGTRPDGLGFTLPGTVSGSKVTIPIDTTLTACAGASIAELVIYDGNGFRFGSANVQIIVEPAAHPDSVIDADEDTIRGLAAEVQEIVDTAAETVAAISEDVIRSEIDEWLDEHPEATTTVQDGTITEKKLSFSLQKKVEAPFDFKPAVKTIVNKNTLNGLSSRYIQGFGYDSLRENYIFAFSVRDESSLLVIVSSSIDISDTSSYVATVTGAWGHGSDIAYDHINDLIYIASADASIGLVALDPNNNYSETYVTLDDYTPAEISTYSDGYFYVSNGTTARKYTNDFSEYAVIETDKLNKAKAFTGEELVTQSTFNYGDRIYNIYGVLSEAANGASSSWTRSYLVVFENDAVLFAKSLNYLYEIEAGFTIGNTLYLISGQMYFSVLECNMAGLSIEDESLTAVIPLPIETDLNTILIPNKYVYQFGVPNEQLTNAPASLANSFYLHVLPYWGNIVQVVVGFSGTQVRNKLYLRTYNYNNASWGSWKRFLLDEDDYTKTRRCSCGYVTDSSKQIIFDIPVSNAEYTYYKTFTVTVRQNGNYILNEVNLKRTEDAAIYKVTLVDDTHFYTRIRLEKQDGTAFTNAVNNDVVAVDCYLSKTDPNA